MSSTPLRAAIERGKLLDVDKILLSQQNNGFSSNIYERTLANKLPQQGRTNFELEINVRENSTGNTLLHTAVSSYLDAVKVRKKNAFLGPFHGNPYAMQIDAQKQQTDEEHNNNAHASDTETPNNEAILSLATVAGAVSRPAQQQDPHYLRLAIVQRLLAAGADPEVCNLAGLTPLQLLKQLETNQSYFFTLPKTSKFSLVATLVAAGERSWEAVPIPCPGIGQALFHVWENYPQDLVCLVHRLEKKEKILMQKILLILQRVLPGSGNFAALRMQILSASLAL